MSFFAHDSHFWMAFQTDTQWGRPSLFRNGLGIASSLGGRGLRQSQREAQLLPTYTQVAQEFADLHDRSGRMKAKGVIRDVVSWEDARAYFHARLTRRLATDELAMEAGADAADVEARLQTVAEAAGVAWDEDADVKRWIEENFDAVKAEVATLGRDAAVEDALESLAGLDDEALKTVMERLQAK